MLDSCWNAISNFSIFSLKLSFCSCPKLKFFNSHFSTLLHQALRLNRFMIFYSKKNSKNFENSTKISKFFRIFFRKNYQEWVQTNRMIKKNEKWLWKNFHCSTAVEMRFQIPRFWVSSSFLTAFRHIIFQKKINFPLKTILRVFWAYSRVTARKMFIFQIAFLTLHYLYWLFFRQI